MQRRGRIALIVALAYAVASILAVAIFYRGDTAPVAVEAAQPDEAEATVQPVAGDAEVSFLEQYRLPSLERMDADKAEAYVRDMQVMRKVSLLGLTEDDYLYPEREMQKADDAIAALGETGGESVTFDGATAGELNTFLRDNAGATVEVHASEIDVDETISVPAGTALIGNGARLVAKAEVAAITLDHVESAAVRGFEIGEGFAYGVYAMGVSNVRVEDCGIRGATRKAAVFMGDCDGIVVRGNRVTGNAQGGLYLNGDIANALIEDNDISDNRGTSNWMAGIVLTGIDVADETDPYVPFQKKVHFPDDQALDSMIKAPHDVIVRDNRVTDNTASGVYCDGPYRVYIVDNKIERNDKEGMCLDYGTVGAYVSGNDIAMNGNRARQTDRDLEYDFVLEWGRMADGSACAKLPGVSIDNSAYNIVYNNNISKNYGSGVKMVRSGVRNIISTNLVTDNNRGEGDQFHFFGVELGWAAADEAVNNLDFTPEYENIVCRNMITGTHYAGIFLSEGTYINDFFDNIIMDATHWAIESLTDQFNSIVNNYTPLESRGL